MCNASVLCENDVVIDCPTSQTRKQLCKLDSLIRTGIPKQRLDPRGKCPASYSRQEPRTYGHIPPSEIFCRVSINIYLFLDGGGSAWILPSTPIPSSTFCDMGLMLRTTIYHLHAASCNHSIRTSACFIMFVTCTIEKGKNAQPRTGWLLFVETVK